MPSLSNHQSNDFTKCLLIGESKAGKTGSLTSLVKAGYDLRILDYDNGLDTLKQFVLHECPERIDSVEFRTLRDRRKATQAGSVIDGTPMAFVNGLKMLDRWKYDDVDLGIPAQWGPNCILVIDSLSRFCDAAFDFRLPLTPGYSNNKYDPRAVYKDAQDAVINAIGLLTSESFATNVIILAHIRYLDMPDGTKKGFPQSVGSAICSEIPQWFNSYALYENRGGKRTIRTTSTGLIDLANPAPFKMAPSYPIETGLAEFFAVLRDNPGATNGTSSPPSPRLLPTVGPQGGSSQREQTHGGTLPAHARRVQIKP